MPAYCPAVKMKCNNSSIVKSVEKLIRQLESKDITDFIPVTPKELYLTKNALRLYLKECSTCARHTANDHICISAAVENLQRRIPMFSKNDLNSALGSFFIASLILHQQFGYVA